MNRTSPAAADSGVDRVEEALLAAMRGDRAGAAKMMFRLFTRDQALEALNALVLTGAGALAVGACLPGGGEYRIEDLAARVERIAPASEPVDLALFWELLQFVGSLAGGIRQPAEGLATRWSGERLLYGAFVVAQTLLETVAERNGMETEAVMLPALEWAHAR